MNREEAQKAIRENVKNEHLIRHMLATEVIMRALACKFGGDEEEWGLSGLLHDIDVELTAGDMYRHGREGADMVRKLGAGEPVAAAVLCHNETHGIPPKTDMEKALFCTDPLTGLITAAVLVRPDKKIATLEAKSVPAPAASLFPDVPKSAWNWTSLSLSVCQPCRALLMTSAFNLA